MISFVAEFKDSKVLDTSLWPMIAPRSMPLNLGTGREISVIQSLSLVNKHFRSLVVHSVFHNVKVYGDWRRTLRCFDTLSKNVDLYPHVRYGRARILPSWIQLSIMRSVQHTNMLSQDSQTRHPTKLQWDSTFTTCFLRHQIMRDSGSMSKPQNRPSQHWRVTRGSHCQLHLFCQNLLTHRWYRIPRAIQWLSHLALPQPHYHQLKWMDFHALETQSTEQYSPPWPLTPAYRGRRNSHKARSLFNEWLVVRRRTSRYHSSTWNFSLSSPVNEST